MTREMADTNSREACASLRRGYPDFEHPDMQKYLHPDGNNKVQV